MVWPEFPDTYWSFRHALAFERKRAAFPPLGLQTIAAMLPSEWQIELVDMNVRKLKYSHIANADLVFVSAMLVQKRSLLQVVERAKKAGKFVVVGGPFVSTCTERIPGADCIFIGEAEELLPEFIHDLEMRVPRPTYQAEEKPGLQNTPVPRFDLSPLKYYGSMAIQFSRGCPFTCEFCDIIDIYGRKPRTKTSAQMIAELDALLALGWHGMVFIVDDNFIGNKPAVKKFLPVLAKWSRDHGHPFAFITEASVNLANDDELLLMMQEAGFTSVFLGIETPVTESLREAKKGQNLRGNLLDAVRKIQGYGIEVMAGFIVGFDHDPLNIFNIIIEFIADSGIPIAMAGILQALAGTQLWHRLKGEERLLVNATGDNTDASLNFVSRMDPEVLIAGYQHILDTIYSPRVFYDRVLLSLRRVKINRPLPQRNNLVTNFGALCRLLFTLGIRSPHRREFWRFLDNCLTDPETLLNGLRFAALGYHFQRVLLSQGK